MSLALDLGVVVVTLLLMLAVGLELDLAAFRRLASCRRALGLALLVQWILLPALAFLLARLLGLAPHLAAALLLLAACPVGDITNYYTLLARGNLAASIALNAVSCLLAPLTMAGTLAVSRWLGQGEDLFQLPGALMVIRLVGLVVVPLAAGVMLRRFQRTLAARLSPWVRRLTGLGIVGVIVLVLVTQHAQLAADWRPTVVAVLLFMLASLALGGLFLGLGAGRQRAEMAAVTLSFPTRNIGLACAIAISLVGRPEYAAFAVTYFLVEVPLLVLAARCLGSRMPRPADAI